jgi:FKBP-type peptidyl-prolyl cis-trans isomerase
MKTIPFALLCALAIAPAAAQGIPECDDVKTTASGLKYCVLAPGRKEPGPVATDMVQVHYTGWLTDGKKFDSSKDHGKPLTFPLNGVIKGWTEGLQLMTPGARFKFEIPPALGYGAQDNGVIPPNSTLVFEVELLKVMPLPKFVAADPEKQKDLPSGAKWQTLKTGTGAAAGPDEAVAFRYAYFTPDGALMDCSERQQDHCISGTKATLPFPFLKDLVDLMKLGDQVRVQVPAGTIGSVPDESVWLIELVGIHRLPKFRALDPAKTVTTESGLKYEVLHQGDGPRPRATQTVSALYTGWLPDGTMFDSAHARGAPSEFALNRVIKGWTEGLQLMATGSSFLFEIPPELAYGVHGSPPVIGANATLVFLVELVGVK